MIVKDVVCPFCGCLCDDIEVEVEGNRVVAVANACELGATKLTGEKRMKNPILRDGDAWKDISYDEAIRYAADMLLRPSGRSSTGGAAPRRGPVRGCTWPSSCAASSTTLLGLPRPRSAIQEVGHPGARSVS